jgi:hypothetical protein
LFLVSEELDSRYLVLGSWVLASPFFGELTFELFVSYEAVSDGYLEDSLMDAST